MISFAFDAARQRVSRAPPSAAEAVRRLIEEGVRLSGEEQSGEAGRGAGEGPAGTDASSCGQPLPGQNSGGEQEEAGRWNAHAHVSQSRGDWKSEKGGEMAGVGDLGREGHTGQGTSASASCLHFWDRLAPDAGANETPELLMALVEARQAMHALSRVRELLAEMWREVEEARLRRGGVGEPHRGETDSGQQDEGCGVLRCLTDCEKVLRDGVGWLKGWGIRVV